MTKKIIFGLIGAGSSATNIATSISNMENAEIISVTSQPIATAQKLAKNLGIGKVSETNEDLLAISETDAIIISVPHGLHHPITLQALKAGKHVLCEKPLAINMAEGNEMITLAKESGLQLGTFFQMRFADSSLEAKKIVDEGKLGRILHSQVNVLWYRNEEYYSKSAWRGKWKTEGGGCLINQSCHSIDLMMWLMGKPKTLFGVFGAKTHDIEVDDNAAAVIEFENGAYGTIQTSVSCEPGYTNEVHVYGSQGSISIIGTHLKWTHKDGNVEEVSTNAQVGSANDPKLFSMLEQTRIIADFIEAVHNNRPPTVDGAEGLRAIEIIEGIYNSNGEKIINF